MRGVKASNERFQDKQKEGDVRMRNIVAAKGECAPHAMTLGVVVSPPARRAWRPWFRAPTREESRALTVIDAGAAPARQPGNSSTLCSGGVFAKRGWA
jgi:hypothetical protein